MELQETCRTCSISDSNDLARVSKSYVYIDGGIVSISNILLDLLSVAEDSSILICESCKSHLVQFYRFKQKFLENERINGHDIVQKEEITLKTKITEIVEDYLKSKPRKRKAKEVWRCPDCPRSFPRSCQLSIHQKICNQSNINDRFEDVEYLTSEPPNVFHASPGCTLISEVQDGSITNYDDFIEEEFVDLSFPCSKCNESFSTSLNLQHHFENIHLEKNLEADDLKRCNTEAPKKKKYKKEQLVDQMIQENFRSKTYPCQECDDVFISEETMNQHLIVKHQFPNHKILFQCPACSIFYATQQFLNQHVQNCPLQAKKFTCTICSRSTFNSQLSLDCHIKIKHWELDEDFLPSNFDKHLVPGEPKSWKCPICGVLSKQINNHKMHVIRHKIKEGQIAGLDIDCDDVASMDSNEIELDQQMEEISSCPECSSVFQNHQEYSYHYQNYGKLRKCVRFQCKKCNVVFGISKSLETHLKNHKLLEPTVDLMNYPECKTCSIGFSDQNYLDEHLKDHSSLPQASQDETYEFIYASLEDDANKPFKCGHCRNRFYDKSQLNLHMMLFHATSFQCPFDQHSFDKAHGKIKFFVDHLKSRHPQSVTSSTECSYCHEVLENKFELSSHRAKCVGRTFNCHHCDKTFGTEKVLRAHLKKVTSGGFKCELCVKVCGTKSDLMTHQRTHNKDKPFKCPQCDKHFSTQSHRASHLDTHRKTKMHQCTFCEEERYFQTRGSLRAHININHKQKLKSVCLYCEKEFSTKSHMLRHAQKAHKD